MDCLRCVNCSGSPWPWLAPGPRRWPLTELPIANIDAREPSHRYRALSRRPFVRSVSFGSSRLSRRRSFFVAAAMLNRLTLILAPVALASVLLYSFTKRWTLLSHLVLGWCLAIAPTGAWIAVRGALDSPVPLLLSLVVLLWTAGFDVLYACQDYDFDVSRGSAFDSPSLRNRAFAVDRPAACTLARLSHCLRYTGLRSSGRWRLVGVIATGVLLIYQHRLVRADDLSRLNAAFFTTNAFVSVILFLTFGGAALIKDLVYEFFSRSKTNCRLRIRLNAASVLSFDDGRGTCLRPMICLRWVNWPTACAGRKHGRTTYFNVNRHFNPTNVCYADCKFCGFYRTPRQPDAYTHNIDDSLRIAGEAVKEGATELHIAGGLNTKLPFSYFTDLLSTLKQTLSAAASESFHDGGVRSLRPFLQNERRRGHPS